MNVAIYMEGGGQGKDSKVAIRQGMDTFLTEIKEACRNKSWHWRLVCCGPRNEAYRRFRNELLNNSEGIVVLLVDSENTVSSSAPEKHLATRDGWDFQGIDKDIVHLMVQAMETWIAADPDTLKEYYGQGFRRKALPSHKNLEEVSKKDIAEALNRATQETQKGKYDKIRHARHLLQRMDAVTVRQRCFHCKRLFETLLHLIR